MKEKPKTVRIAIIATLFLAISLNLTFSQNVEIWHYWLSGGEKQAIDALMEVAKKENPSTIFISREIPGSVNEIRRQLGAALLAGNPPEIYQAGLGLDLKSYVDGGHLRQLDDIWAQIDGDKIFSSGIQKIVKINGHPYAIPLNMHVVTHIFYNKKIFDNLGLKVPENDEEFLKVTQVLKKNNIEPFAAAGKQWTIYHIFPCFIDVLGIDGYMKLGNGAISWTDPKVRKAFEQYGKMFVQNYMFGWSGYGWADAANEMMKGNVAMYLSGDWVVSYFETAGWKSGVDFSSFPAPGTQNAVVVQVDGLASPLQCRNPKGAKQFLLSAAGVAGQSAFNKYKGSIAANLNVKPDIYTGVMRDTYDRIQQLAKTGTILPNLAAMFPPPLWAELKTQVEIYALNPSSATLDKALSTLEALRQDQIKKNAFANLSEMN